MKPEELLRNAADIIEERGKLRDKPTGERSMARAVDAFNGLLGGDRRLSESEGWLFMCCLKMARGTAGNPHIDDAADLAGYAALWGECYSMPKPEPGKEAPYDYDVGEQFRALEIEVAEARLRAIRVGREHG